MFALVYNSVVSLLIGLLKITAVFHSGFKQFFRERSKASLVEAGSKKYWIHCASLGEYEMALPLIKKIKEDSGISKILITFFSPSGYTQAIKNSELASAIMYLPLDTPSAVEEFYQRYQIEKAVLVRYELWYNLIRKGLDHGVSFYLINARFREGQFIFKTYGKPYLKLLSKFKKIFTSDQESFTLLQKFSFEGLVRSGDTRVERVLEIKDRAKEYQDIKEFKGECKLIIFGSSWQPEEKMLAEIIKDLPDHKWVVAPHDVGKEHIVQIENLFRNTTTVKFSQGVNCNAQVLLLDEIGHLSSIYQYADLAVVGGGFRGALHNTYEPMVWGVPILFGPKHEKYPEGQLFIDKGMAFEFLDGLELKSMIKSNLEQPEVFVKRSADFIEESKGSVAAILDQLKS